MSRKQRADSIREIRRLARKLMKDVWTGRDLNIAEHRKKIIKLVVNNG